MPSLFETFSNLSYILSFFFRKEIEAKIAMERASSPETEATENQNEVWNYKICFYFLPKLSLFEF